MPISYLNFLSMKNDYEGSGNWKSQAVRQVHVELLNYFN